MFPATSQTTTQPPAGRGRRTVSDIASNSAAAAPTRVDALAELTGGVAHDLNNLLTVIIGASEALADDLAAGSAPQDLALLSLRAAEHGSSLLRRLMAFARDEVIEPQVVDCAEALAAVEPLAEAIARPDIALEITPAPYPLFCRADAPGLQSSLLNLCINARDAMPNGGLLALLTEAVWLEAPQAGACDLPTGSYVRFTVRDTGLGMPPEVLARATEPFFTTKGAAGAGLGLSSIQAFAREAGGGLAITSAPGQGARIELYLPRVAVRTKAAPQPASKVE